MANIAIPVAVPVVACYGYSLHSVWLFATQKTNTYDNLAALRVVKGATLGTVPAGALLGGMFGYLRNGMEQKC